MSSPRLKRPFSVTVLAVLVLSLAVMHVFGALEAWRHWYFLQELPLTVPVAYLAGKNLFWGLAGAVIAVGLWLGKRWAWLGMQIATGVYAGLYWVDRLWLAPSSMLAIRWPFAVGLTAFYLLYTFYVLRRPQGRAFFMAAIEVDE